MLGSRLTVASAETQCRERTINHPLCVHVVTRQKLHSLRILVQSGVFFSLLPLHLQLLDNQCVWQVTNYSLEVLFNSKNLLGRDNFSMFKDLWLKEGNRILQPGQTGATFIDIISIWFSYSYFFLICNVTLLGKLAGLYLGGMPRFRKQ